MSRFDEIPSQSYAILADYLDGHRPKSDAVEALRNLSFWLRTFDETQFQQALAINKLFDVTDNATSKIDELRWVVNFVSASLRSGMEFDPDSNTISLESINDWPLAVLVGFDVVTYFAEYNRHRSKMRRRSSISAAFDYIIPRSGIPLRDYDTSMSNPTFRNDWYIGAPASTLYYTIRNTSLTVLSMPPSHGSFKDELESFIEDMGRVRTFLGHLAWLRRLVIASVGPTARVEDKIASVPLSISPIELYPAIPLPSFVARANKYRPSALY